MSAWSSLKIKDLGRVVTGKTPPTEVKEFFEGDELFVSPKDLDWNQYYVHETETRVSEKAFSKFKNQVLPAKSVMFTCISFAFGKMGITSRPSLTNQQVNSIVVNDNHDFRFVFYLLKAYKPFIFSYNSGIDTPIVPKSVFEGIGVLCPPKPIQQKIAAILSAYDDLIANNQRRITLLERMAEDIYREWFVRLRFPGHENTTIEKGVPKDWGFVKTDKAFKFYGGATPARDTPRFWQSGDVNWFTPTDITGADGMFLEASSEQCTDEGLRNCSSTLFPPYSVMMTSRATIGAIGINLTPACTNQGFITCIPNDAYPLAYLYHWIKLGKPHFESLSGGSTFAELTKGTFKRMEILTPPQALVQQFQQLVAPLFKSMETHLKANASLKSTRDVLLPRLISGKLSVDALDIRFPQGMTRGLESNS